MALSPLSSAWGQGTAVEAAAPDTTVRPTADTSADTHPPARLLQSYSDTTGFGELSKEYPQLRRWLPRVPIRSNPDLVPQTVADTTPKRTVRSGRVVDITIYGNRITKQYVVLAYLKIDKGMLVDSEIIAASQKSLMSTGIFARAEIFTVPRDNGVVLQVVLVERGYNVLTDVGGELLKRYGEIVSRPIWYRGRIRLGMTRENFRGRMESFRVAFSLVEWRSLLVSWTKPVLTTPWFYQIGSGISDNPSTSDPLRTQTISLSLSGGVRPAPPFRAYLSVVPMFKNTQVVAPGNLDRIADALSERSDSSGDAERFLQRWERLVDERNRFGEVVIGIGAIYDRRKSRFDPRKGCYLSLYGRVNPDFPGRDAFRSNPEFVDTDSIRDPRSQAYLRDTVGYRASQPRELLSRQFWQLEADASFYKRGFFPKKRDVFAARTRLLIRNREGGLLNRVSAGGRTSVRGYGSGDINNNTRANNSIQASGEYRFTVGQTPPLNMLPMLDFRNLGYDLRGLYYRLDLGLFVDAAFVWDNWSEPVHPRYGHQTAMSAGIGIRIAIPSVAHIIAFDVAPLAGDPNGPRNLLTTRAAKSNGYQGWGWRGRWELGLDLPF